MSKQIQNLVDQINKAFNDNQFSKYYQNKCKITCASREDMLKNINDNLLALESTKKSVKHLFFYTHDMQRLQLLQARIKNASHLLFFTVETRQDCLIGMDIYHLHNIVRFLNNHDVDNLLRIDFKLACQIITEYLQQNHQLSNKERIRLQMALDDVKPFNVKTYSK